MSEESQARQPVVFTPAAEQYAPAIEQVHEIIRYDAPRSVASPISWVRGAISLRGRVESGDETAGVIVDQLAAQAT